MIKNIIVFSILFSLLTGIILNVSTAQTDRFGIKEVYNTIPNGREWFSRWDNGHARTWTEAHNDPDDPEWYSKGSGTWSTRGNGILNISGKAPRMFVIDPNRTKYWHNVEITLYGMRISDTNIDFGGISGYARTNHMVLTNYCDTRGYGSRFRYDGNLDFVKETKHDAGYDQKAKKSYFSNRMPKNVWIGYKFVVYDLPNGNVKLELWMDSTDGLNGGNWIKVNEFIDNGNNFGVGYAPCKLGIDPALPLTSSDNRLGSETGKPNLDVYFRSDGVDSNGLLYKKASIREIAWSRL